jgi:UPF0716 protein FxsA
VFLLFVLLLVVIPIVELTIIVQVAGSIGVLTTIALLLLVSFTGAWLVKREGLGVLARVQRQLESGELPTNDVVDGLLILVAGALLLTPGFLTDAVGLLMLFPLTRIPVRAMIIRHYRHRLDSFATNPASGFGRVRFFTNVVDVDAVRDDPPTRGPDSPPELDSWS